MSIIASTGVSKNSDSFRAGMESAKMAMEDINEPNVIILYASIYHNHEMVLKGVREIFQDTPLIGGSTFGEMTNYGMDDNSVVLMAIKTDSIKFYFGLGKDSDRNPELAAIQSAKEALNGLEKNQPAVGIFTSEMLGGTKALDGLQRELPEGLSLFGGCCSGNRKVPIRNPEFTKGYQYFNDKVYRHSVPLMLLSGDFKYSFGVGHGWRPLGKTAKVGKAEGNKIYELDNLSALDFYRRYLGESTFVPYPLGFYHNDHLLLRAVTGMAENGGLSFTTDITPGTDVRMTIGSRANIFKSSAETAQKVLDSLGTAKPKLAIVSSCISRRTMLGARVQKELEVIQEVLGKKLPLIGGYCAGEFAPVSGKNFYHNFSFCLCLLGEETSDVPQEITIELPEKPRTKRDLALIITQNENIVSDCSAALAELQVDSQWAEDKSEAEDKLKKDTPQIVILDAEYLPFIQNLKQVNPNIQTIVLIEKDLKESQESIVNETSENICGFCPLPLRKYKLKFLINKALCMHKVCAENQTTTSQLQEAIENLDEAEEHIEVTEKVVMASYREIESAHDYIHNVIKCMTDCLIVTGPDGKINTVNEAAINLLGYSKDELLSKSFETIFPDNVGEKLVTLIDKDNLTNHETVLESKDGWKIPVLLSSSVMKDERGNVTAIVYTAKDITKRKKAENDLKETMAKLEEANQNMKQFVYIASHDLREPLRKVTSFGAILKDSIIDKLSEDDTENLNYMIDGAERMSQMIEGLLAYSRVNTKGHPLEIVDLNEILTQIRELELSVLIDEKNVTLEIPQELPSVNADPVQLRQLLQNLIANGIKYQPKDSTPQITITSRPADNGMVRIEVSDNGIGVKPEDQNAVFEMFRRLHTRNEYEGTGIGLAVCKKIVERHGGQIGLESEFGKGSTFWFTVPATEQLAATVA